MLHQHPLPAVEDMFNKLKDRELFSQIDLADARLQIEVDNESKDLLDQHTSRFIKLQPPDLWSKICSWHLAADDRLNDCLNGVAAYLDDIIVTGRKMKEHRQNLDALFKRIHTYGFRVRMD
ncbi:hypothetical protein ANCDUO_12431 [Ancylostoma duodenale]|uniref:Reverse transcriptase domain-containing protein n=1 Tax=Ancylostoma duodenale TaxID=51022 RepID=A0A0C2G8Y2_9BILA|nr:hypothetical protein ANCDUO_12431 [Ancylostoma duodenale]